MFVTKGTTSVAFNGNMGFTDTGGGTAGNPSVAFSDTAPDQPTTVSPANGATGVSLTPTLQGSAYAAASGGPQTGAEFQIATNANFTTPLVWDKTLSTAAISATVPAGTLSAGNTYYWQVRYEDASGFGEWSNAASFTAGVPVTLAPATLPADTAGLAYDQAIIAGGGSGTLTLVVSNIQNAIPGLTVPGSGTTSFVVSGTPTAAGDETFTVTATDSLGDKTTQNYSITVNPATALAPAALPADTADFAYHQTITASGGTGTVTLTVSDILGAINGLTVPASGTGNLAVSGTPTAAGTETFAVTATDSLRRRNSERLQHHGQRRREPEPGDPAGRYGERGLRPFDHGRRRHGHGHAGSERHPGSNLRADRALQRHGKPGHQRHARGGGNGNVRRHRHRFARRPRPRRTTALRLIRP